MQATQNGDDQLIKYGEENDVTQGERIYKDYSKPDGEACRDDGTLKDASEMEWPNSPSDSNPYNVNPGDSEESIILKGKPLGDSDEDDSGYEKAELTKVKVSCNSLRKYFVPVRSWSLMNFWSSEN